MYLHSGNTLNEVVSVILCKMKDYSVFRKLKKLCYFFGQNLRALFQIVIYWYQGNKGNLSVIIFLQGITFHVLGTD